MIAFAALLVGAYVLGSIPFGVLVARARGVDITKIGSGNIGATNVHRALGWKLGLAVLLLDVLKGFLPAVIARSLAIQFAPSLTTMDIALLAGFTAVLGHCASVFLGFKGGKGIATILGTALGATPILAAIGLAVFLVVFVTTRYVSLASILGVLAAVLAACFLRYDALIVVAYFGIWFFIIYKHRANIRRLMKGEEPRTSFRGGEKSEEAKVVAEEAALMPDEKRVHPVESN